MADPNQVTLYQLPNGQFLSAAELGQIIQQQSPVQNPALTVKAQPASNASRAVEIAAPNPGTPVVTSNIQSMAPAAGTLPQLVMVRPVAPSKSPAPVPQAAAGSAVICATGKRMKKPPQVMLVPANGLLQLPAGVRLAAIPQGSTAKLQKPTKRKVPPLPGTQLSLQGGVPTLSSAKGAQLRLGAQKFTSSQTVQPMFSTAGFIQTSAGFIQTSVTTQPPIMSCTAAAATAPSSRSVRIQPSISEQSAGQSLQQQTNLNTVLVTSQPAFTSADQVSSVGPSPMSMNSVKFNPIAVQSTIPFSKKQTADSTTSMSVLGVDSAQYSPTVTCTTAVTNIEISPSLQPSLSPLPSLLPQSVLPPQAQDSSLPSGRSHKPVSLMTPDTSSTAPGSGLAPNILDAVHSQVQRPPVPKSNVVHSQVQSPTAAGFRLRVPISSLNGQLGFTLPAGLLQRAKTLSVCPAGSTKKMGSPRVITLMPRNQAVTTTSPKISSTLVSAPQSSSQHKLPKSLPDIQLRYEIPNADTKESGLQSVRIEDELTVEPKNENEDSSGIGDESDPLLVLGSGGDLTGSPCQVEESPLDAGLGISRVKAAFRNTNVLQNAALTQEYPSPVDVQSADVGDAMISSISYVVSDLQATEPESVTASSLTPLSSILENTSLSSGMVTQALSEASQQMMDLPLESLEDFPSSREDSGLIHDAINIGSDILQSVQIGMPASQEHAQAEQQDLTSCASLQDPTAPSVNKMPTSIATLQSKLIPQQIVKNEKSVTANPKSTAIFPKPLSADLEKIPDLSSLPPVRRAQQPTKYSNKRTPDPPEKFPQPSKWTNQRTPDPPMQETSGSVEAPVEDDDKSIAGNPFFSRKDPSGQVVDSRVLPSDSLGETYMKYLELTNGGKTMTYHDFLKAKYSGKLPSQDDCKSQLKPAQAMFDSVSFPVQVGDNPVDKDAWLVPLQPAAGPAAAKPKSDSYQTKCMDTTDKNFVTLPAQVTMLPQVAPGKVLPPGINIEISPTLLQQVVQAAGLEIPKSFLDNEQKPNTKDQQKPADAIRAESVAQGLGKSAIGDGLIFSETHQEPAVRDQPVVVAEDGAKLVPQDRDKSTRNATIKTIADKEVVIQRTSIPDPRTDKQAFKIVGCLTYGVGICGQIFAPRLLVPYGEEAVGDIAADVTTCDIDLETMPTTLGTCYLKPIVYEIPESFVSPYEDAGSVKIGIRGTLSESNLNFTPSVKRAGQQPISIDPVTESHKVCELEKNDDTNKSDEKKGKVTEINVEDTPIVAIHCEDEFKMQFELTDGKYNDDKTTCESEDFKDDGEIQDRKTGIVHSKVVGIKQAGEQSECMLSVDSSGAVFSVESQHCPPESDMEEICRLEDGTSYMSTETAMDIGLEDDAGVSGTGDGVLGEGPADDDHSSQSVDASILDGAHTEPANSSSTSSKSNLTNINEAHVESMSRDDSAKTTQGEPNACVASGVSVLKEMVAQLNCGLSDSQTTEGDVESAEVQSVFADAGSIQIAAVRTCDPRQVDAESVREHTQLRSDNDPTAVVDEIKDKSLHVKAEILQFRDLATSSTTEVVEDVAKTRNSPISVKVATTIDTGRPPQAGVTTESVSQDTVVVKKDSEMSIDIEKLSDDEVEWVAEHRRGLNSNDSSDGKMMGKTARGERELAAGERSSDEQVASLDVTAAFEAATNESPVDVNQHGDGNPLESIDDLVITEVDDNDAIHDLLIGNEAEDEDDNVSVGDETPVQPTKVDQMLLESLLASGSDPVDFSRFVREPDHCTDGGTVGVCYGCYLCPFASVAQRSVMDHWMREHLQHKPYQCPYCKVESVTSQRIQHHIAQHHPGAPTVVSIVPSSIYQESIELDMRLIDSENITVPSVDVQEKRRIGTDELEGQATAYIDIIFQCIRCDYNTQRVNAVRHHIRTAHLKVKSYMCPYCARKFSTSLNAKRHVSLHHPTESLKVYVSKLGATKISLEHINRYFVVHPLNDSGQLGGKSPTIRIEKYWQTAGEEGAIMCRRCTFECKNVNEMWGHVRSIHEVPRYCVCMMCEHSHLLKRTERLQCWAVCTNCKSIISLCIDSNTSVIFPKMFMCLCCNYRTHERSGMIRHIKYVHVKCHAFVCPYCPYKGVEKPKVRLHIQMHHPRQALMVGKDELVIARFMTIIRGMFKEILPRNRKLISRTAVYDPVWDDNDNLNDKRPEINTIDEGSGDEAADKQLDPQLHPSVLELRKSVGYRVGARFQSKGPTLTEVSDLVKHTKTAGMKPNTYRYYMNEEFDGCYHFKCVICHYRCIDRSCMSRHVKYIHLRAHPHRCVYCDYSNVEKTKVKLHIQAFHKDLPIHVTSDSNMISHLGKLVKKYFVAVMPDSTERPIRTQTLVNSVKSKDDWINWAMEYMEMPPKKRSKQDKPPSPKSSPEPALLDVETVTSDEDWVPKKGRPRAKRQPAALKLAQATSQAAKQKEQQPPRRGTKRKAGSSKSRPSKAVKLQEVTKYKRSHLAQLLASRTEEVKYLRAQAAARSTVGPPPKLVMNNAETGTDLPLIKSEPEDDKEYPSTSSWSGVEQMVVEEVKEEPASDYENILSGSSMKTLGVIEAAGDSDVDLEECMQDADLEDIEALLNRVKQETTGQRFAREAGSTYTKPVHNRKRYCKRIGRVMVEPSAYGDPKLHAKPIVLAEDVIQKILSSYD